MLKACWDCLVGYDLMRERSSAEEPHRTQLNGTELTNRAPPWPQPQLKNENMYILPKRFNTQDVITVAGEMQSEPKILSVGLVTGYNSADYENIACQLEVNYPPNEDKIAIKIIKDGYHQVVNDSNSTSDFFAGTNFEVKFLMRGEGYLDIYVGDSYLEGVVLKHSIDQIRFLTVSGDVTKVSRLDFQFG